MGIEGEFLVDLSLLSQKVNGKALKVLAEITKGMQIDGQTSVDWRLFRERDGIDRRNLWIILDHLERVGVVSRVVNPGGRSSWNVLWVNPAIVRHVHTNNKYVASMAKRFMKLWSAQMEQRGTKKPSEEGCLVEGGGVQTSYSGATRSLG